MEAHICAALCRPQVEARAGARSSGARSVQTRIRDEVGSRVDERARRDARFDEGLGLRIGKL